MAEPFGYLRNRYATCQQLAGVGVAEGMEATGRGDAERSLDFFETKAFVAGNQQGAGASPEHEAVICMSVCFPLHEFFIDRRGYGNLASGA